MQSRDLRRRETWVVVQVLEKYRTILACLAAGSTKERVRTLTGKYCAYPASPRDRTVRVTGQLSETTQRRSIITSLGIQSSNGLPLRGTSPHCSARPPMGLA